MKTKIWGGLEPPPVSKVFSYAFRNFKIWIAASLFPACYFADHYLLLVWFYGFLRVHREGLYFTSMPVSKSIEDYVVSNGDHISKADGYLSFPLAVAVWLASIFIGYLAVKRRVKI